MIDENMVERVARALYDDWVREEGDRGEEYCSWDLLPDKDTWRPRARAVLEAMREPTEAMLMAAAKTPGMEAVNSVMQLHQARGHGFPAGAFDDGYPLQQAWRAMIDAASGPIPIVDMKDLG